MSISKIANKIIEDAEKKAQLLIDKSKTEAQNIIDKARNDANADAKVIEEVALRRNDENIGKTKGLADLEGKKIKLSAKQECIDDVYMLTLKKVEELSDSEYLNLIKSLLNKIEITTKAEIIFNKKDKNRFTDDDITKINPLVSISEKTGSFRCGFILSFSDTEYNCSFEELVKSAIEDNKKEIADILFG